MAGVIDENEVKKLAKHIRNDASAAIIVCECYLDWLEKSDRERDEEVIRAFYPALTDAWDKYQMLLKLTKEI